MNTFTKWEIPIPDQNTLNNLPEKIEIVSQRLYSITKRYPKSKLASSLAVEDMVITDLIAKLALSISIFTLETEQLNQETLDLIPIIYDKYKIIIETFHPIKESVDNYIIQHGLTAFYESVELRKKCCYIRKIEPLDRALLVCDAWLTGQRKEQSITREELQWEEKDKTRNIAKFNPIFDWTESDVWAYILNHDVPYNKLYTQGYPSIGCEPCTKPVRKNENIRAGRWWWEQKDSKECGLHIN